jgi:CRISPR-associated protein Cas2
MADPMWLLVMFDLPVKKKQQRLLATRYRQRLLDLGFSRVQYSVYCKYLVNGSGVRTLLPSLRDVPPEGAVRVVRLTDEQWAHTYRYYGHRQIPNAYTPGQLTIFE